jgi:hypothetical protein
LKKRRYEKSLRGTRAVMEVEGLVNMGDIGEVKNGLPLDSFGEQLKELSKSHQSYLREKVWGDDFVSFLDLIGFDDVLFSFRKSSINFTQTRSSLLSPYVTSIPSTIRTTLQSTLPKQG